MKLTKKFPQMKIIIRIYNIFQWSQGKYKYRNVPNENGSVAISWYASLAATGRQFNVARNVK